MNKKYELTDETFEIKGTVLHRIKALKDFGNIKAGDLGGFIEKEENLSQEGNCWVEGGCSAEFSGFIYGEARVRDNSIISKMSYIYGTAKIFGDSVVDHAPVSSGLFNNAYIERDHFLHIEGSESITIYLSNTKDKYIVTYPGNGKGIEFDKFIELAKEKGWNTRLRIAELAKDILSI